MFWIWNPGKFPSFCTGVMKMYNFGQIPSVILVDWAVFWIFPDFTKMWTRWNFESMFLKIVHQKGLFDAIKENPNFPSCRKILDIYGQWLIKTELNYVNPHALPPLWKRFLWYSNFSDTTKCFTTQIKLMCRNRVIH